MELATNLLKSGSDIVIEQCLADVLGKCIFDSGFERSFKDTIAKQEYTELFNPLRLLLRSGPGPTAQRALKNPAYLPMVAQLSLLCFTQEVESLAEGLRML